MIYMIKCGKNFLSYRPTSSFTNFSIKIFSRELSGMGLQQNYFNSTTFTVKDRKFQNLKLIIGAMLVYQATKLVLLSLFNFEVLLLFPVLLRTRIGVAQHRQSLCSKTFLRLSFPLGMVAGPCLSSCCLCGAALLSELTRCSSCPSPNSHCFVIPLCGKFSDNHP